MASGYEKRDCGVDPSDGWAKPGRVENAFLAILGAVGGLMGAGSLFLSIRAVLLAIGGGS